MCDERMMNMTRFAEPDWRGDRLHRTAHCTALGGSEYDAAGNMTRSPYIDSEVGHARRHAYDAWNRVVEIQFNNGNTVWTLRYDGLNRLIEREKISGTENPTYDHYYNRDWQLLETHKDDTLHWQHVWSQRYIDAPVLWDRDIDDDGQFDKRFYFATDANMNVTALFDDAGVPKERYTYDAYGNPRMRFADYSEQGNNQSNFDNHWYFAGYFKLPQDAYHVRNRMYHPTLGAWMQREPLPVNAAGGEYRDGTSLYQYVQSRVLRYGDPLGLISKAFWQALVDLKAGINPALWNPQDDLYAPGSPTHKFVGGIYESYARFAREAPSELLWAGSAATIAGPAVKDGLSTLQTGVDEAERPEARRDYEEALVTIMAMAKAVFDDLAWQHEAYLDGFENIEFLHRQGDIPEDAYEAWCKIHEGDVVEGNKMLLTREQKVILQPFFDDMSRLLAETFSFNAGSGGLPDAEGFREFHDDQWAPDFRDFDTRIEWQRDHILDIWSNLPQEERDERLPD